MPTFLQPAYGSLNEKREAGNDSFFKINSLFNTPSIPEDFICWGLIPGLAGLELHPSPAAVRGLGLHKETASPFLMASSQKPSIPCALGAWKGESKAQ